MVFDNRVKIDSKGLVLVPGFAAPNFPDCLSSDGGPGPERARPGDAGGRGRSAHGAAWGSVEIAIPIPADHRSDSLAFVSVSCPGISSPNRNLLPDLPALPLSSFTLISISYPSYSPPRFSAAPRRSPDSSATETSSPAHFPRSSSSNPAPIPISKHCVRRNPLIT